MAIITELVVETRGAFIGKFQGRLQVRVNNEVVQQAPIMHLEQVIITGKAVSLSSDVIEACAEEGIPIHFVDGLGRAYANLYAAGLTGTVQTRRAQLLAYSTGRGMQLAVAMAMAKLGNQAALLRYLVKNRKESEPELYQAVKLIALEVEEPQAELARLGQSGQVVEVGRMSLMGFEGQAAQRYWHGVRQVVQVGDWPGRVGRGATDPTNSALNYGYGILYGQIERAIVLAGLDPYAGFIHADRPGKPSLVLDLIEEFRQPIVDRSIFALLNLGTAIEVDEAGQLTEGAKKAIVGRVLERLDKAEKYEGKSVPLKQIIQCQARHVATFLRGDRAEYEGFEVKW